MKLTCAAARARLESGARAERTDADRGERDDGERDDDVRGEGDRGDRHDRERDDRVRGEGDRGDRQDRDRDDRVRGEGDRGDRQNRERDDRVRGEGDRGNGDRHDGVRDDGERGALEEHLAGCASCRAIRDDRAAFAAAIAAAHRPIKAPREVRDAVLATTARRARSRPPLAKLLAAAAGIALVASLATRELTSPSRVHAQTLPELALAHHESVLTGRMPLDLVSSDPTRAVSWLEERIAFRLALPRLDGADLSLIGARVFEARGDLAVFLLYEKGLEPIGLAIAAAERSEAGASTTNPGEPREAASSEMFRNIRFDFHELRGQHVITWIDRGLEYALVSKLPAQGRESCQVCHAPGSGLAGVEDFHRRAPLR